MRRLVAGRGAAVGAGNASSRVAARRRRWKRVVVGRGAAAAGETCRCVSLRAPAQATARPLAWPDWVEGDKGPFGGLASVEVWAATRLRAVGVAAEDTEDVVAEAYEREDLAASTLAGVRVSLSGNPTSRCVPGKHYALRLIVSAITDGAMAVVSSTDAAVECRARGASALMGFLDADGSVQTAAVVRPPHWCGADEPFRVLLALHGTGVSARDSADAFKMKGKGSGDDVPYAFGAPPQTCAYLVAPSRHGAHNWEGVGMRHALRAVDALAAWRGVSQKPAILVAGHSMGGHGAGLLAAALGPAAVGLSVNAGWLRKETRAAGGGHLRSRRRRAPY